MVINIVKAAFVKKYEQDPVILSRIHFDGINRTKFDALVKETKELFNAKSLNELVVKSYQAKLHLEEVGLLKDSIVIVDVDRDETAQDKQFEICFMVKEPNRAKGNVFAGVSNRNEAETTGTGSLPSILGRGEILTGGYTRGHRGTAQWDLGLKKPFLGWQRHSGITVSLSRSYLENPWSRFSLLSHGIATGLYYQLAENLAHQLRWNGVWRELGCLGQDVPFAIRQHSGHSLKSSAESVLTYDTLDSHALPQKGILFKLSQELAGLGGDVKFIRNQVQLVSSTRLFWGLLLSAGTQVSHVSQLSGPTLHLADRCFLGGLTDLRGFETNGVGPSTANCAMGGCSSWSAAVHLYRPLVPPKLLFSHLFAVAGNLAAVDSGATFGEVFRRLAQNPRVSVGMGLVVKFDPIRFELSYCIPLRSQADDRLSHGIQFGAGISFL